MEIIFGFSWSGIAVILLIFVFLGREALPVFLGTTDSAATEDVIPVDQMDRIPREQLRTYLEMTPDEFRRANKETLQALMEVKLEARKEAPDEKAARVNTTQWRYLTGSYQGAGSAKPVYNRQANSQIRK